MTHREIISYRTQFEILWWDLLINLMTSISKIRHRLNHSLPISKYLHGTALEILIGLVWLFLGLYIGFVMGFLGI